jgi:hypothetical protein
MAGVFNPKCLQVSDAAKRPQLSTGVRKFLWECVPGIGACEDYFFSQPRVLFEDGFRERDIHRTDLYAVLRVAAVGDTADLTD